MATLEIKTADELIDQDLESRGKTRVARRIFGLLSGD